MRKEDVRYWDAIAAQDDAAVRDALAGLRSERAFDESGRVDASHFVLPFVSSDDDVLDVGCGIGRRLKWVAPHCSEAIGIDVSGGLLQIARKHLSRLPNVRLKRLPRSLAFPMETGSIDFAYYYRVSVHVDREDNLRILQELRRCLRPRGRALVQFSLIEHPENRKELSRWARERDEEDLGLSYFTESEARIFLDLAKLHPQIRLFVPGEFAVIVTKRDDRVLGEAPLVSVRACAERSHRRFAGTRARRGTGRGPGVRARAGRRAGRLPRSASRSPRSTSIASREDSAGHQWRGGQLAERTEARPNRALARKLAPASRSEFLVRL